MRVFRLFNLQTCIIAYGMLGVAGRGAAQSNGGVEPTEPAPIVGLIETYGSLQVARSSIVEASGVKVGDSLSDVDLKQSIERIQGIPGVRAATAVGVYGRLLKDDSLALVLYLGIEEENAAPSAFGSAPDRDCVLPDEIVNANESEQHAFRSAAARGEFGEDRSKGHSLAVDADWRATQEKFIPLADRHWCVLIDVLHHSRDCEHRAIAAKVIAYSGDKEKVVCELAAAVNDPEPAVRNNATRALSVIFGYARTRPAASISPPPQLVMKLIDMLHSLEWSDRNKAISLLLEIDDSELVGGELRKRAIPNLIEMSNWQTAHGEMAFMLLGSLLGMPHDESRLAWQRGEQEIVIERIRGVASSE